MSTRNYAKEMCNPSLTDNDRLELWFSIYFAKWNSFPLPALNTAFNDAINKFQIELQRWSTSDSEQDLINLKDLGLAFGIVTKDDDMDKVKEVFKNSFENGFSKSTQAAMRKVVGRSLVAAFVAIHSASSTNEGRQRNGTNEGRQRRNGINQVAQKGSSKLHKKLSCDVVKECYGFGHLGVVIDVLQEEAIIDKARALATYGCNYGFTKVAAKFATQSAANPASGYATILGEVAVSALLHSCGVDDPTIDGYAGVSTALVLGAFLVGTPAVAGVVIGQSMCGLFNALEGGYGDNWCYVEVGNLRRGNSGNICASSYKGGDVLKLKSYQNKYYYSCSRDCFSAGNSKESFFKVTFYDEWGTRIRIYNKVWYRDTFFVSKHPDKSSLIIVHAKGSLSLKDKERKGGLIDFYEHDSGWNILKIW